MWASAAVFVIAYIYGCVRWPAYHKFGVFLNLFRDNAYLGLLAIGMTFVILNGGIDLSVGAVLAFSSIFTARVLEQGHWPAWQAITCALALGAGFGFFQGWVISKFSLPPFLVTLAGLFGARGAALLVSHESIGITNQLFVSLGGMDYALPLLFVGTLAIGAFCLNCLPFGRNIYAIGGNEASALLMGLPVHRTKVSIYAISGFCSALAGIAYAINTVAGDAIAATGSELDAIAAVVIGGTVLTGGTGGLGGTLLGVLVLGLIQTVITFDGRLSSWWTKVVIGALLLLFILPQRLMQSADN